MALVDEDAASEAEAEAGAGGGVTRAGVRRLQEEAAPCEVGLKTRAWSEIGIMVAGLADAGTHSDAQHEYTRRNTGTDRGFSPVRRVVESNFSSVFEFLPTGS